MRVQCDHYDEDREKRVAAMREYADEVTRQLDAGNFFLAQGAAYELYERTKADLYMRRMVEDRADKIVSNTKSEER